MAKKSSLKISVVIPVYNDEQFIDVCLEAVFKQTKKPYEVIVVNNNCTDRSMELAKKFKVKIINEPRQGLCFARETGLNHAEGDILVRIDADSVLPEDYLKNINAVMADNSIGGVSAYGISRFEVIPGSSRFWAWCYFTIMEASFGYKILWGSNLVIRKNHWLKIRKYLINNDDLVHEDQDISLALASVGAKAKILSNITISMQMERAQHFSIFHNYVKRAFNLKKIDKQHRRSRLKTRLKKTNMFKRLFLLMITAWSLIAFYLMTIFYSIFWNIKYWFRAN